MGGDNLKWNDWCVAKSVSCFCAIICPITREESHSWRCKMRSLHPILGKSSIYSRHHMRKWHQNADRNSIAWPVNYIKSDQTIMCITNTLMWLHTWHQGNVVLHVEQLLMICEVIYCNYNCRLNPALSLKEGFGVPFIAKTSKNKRDKIPKLDRLHIGNKVCLWIWLCLKHFKLGWIQWLKHM